MNLEKRTQSKGFMFFDRLFRLFICNAFVILSMIIPIGILLWALIALGAGGELETIMMLLWIGLAIFVLLFPFLILPSIVATTAFIKKGNELGIKVRDWFTDFARYYKKSIQTGIIFSIAFLIVGFSIYFYSNVEIVEGGIQLGKLVISANMQNIIIQAGFIVMMLFFIITILLLVHIPLLITTFPKLRLTDFLRTDIFVTINNFMSTIILLTMLIVSIGCFVLFPVWIIFGISLPIMIGVRLTKISYTQLEKVDFDKINQIIEEEEKEEKIE